MEGGRRGPGRIVATAADVAEGAAWLAARDPRLAAALRATGPLPLRRKPPGFGTLLEAVVSQQISTAAAAAILARLAAAGLVSPGPIRAADTAALLACGLSRPKAARLRALAAAAPDLAGLDALPDAEVVARLVRLPGIGTWTAEIYAITALGRADVLAAGDLALREGARLVLGLPDRPSERTLRALAADWSPWRAVAARLLWAYYRLRKAREGAA